VSSDESLRTRSLTYGCLHVMFAVTAGRSNAAELTLYARMQGLDLSDYDSQQYGSDTSGADNGVARKRRRLPLPSELYAPYLDAPMAEGYAEEPEQPVAVPKRVRTVLREYNGWGAGAAHEATPSPRHGPRSIPALASTAGAACCLLCWGMLLGSIAEGIGWGSPSCVLGWCMLRRLPVRLSAEAYQAACVCDVALTSWDVQVERRGGFCTRSAQLAESGWPVVVHHSAAPRLPLCWDPHARVQVNNNVHSTCMNAVHAWAGQDLSDRGVNP
jgi:hypothetical protein